MSRSACDLHRPMSTQSVTVLVLLALTLATVPLAAAPIVVDDFSPGCTLTGNWADNKGNNPEGKGFSSGGCVGGSYHYTSRHGKYARTGRETAVWQANLPRPGRYRVEVTWRATGNRSSKVTYEVRHQAGTTRKVIDQREGGQPGRATLGTFEFAERGVVAMVSDGGSSASIDSAQFTWAGAGGGGSDDGGVTDLGTGTGTTSGSGAGGRPGSLDDVLGGAAGADGQFGAGRHTWTAPSDGEVRVTCCLGTYGGASLEVRVAPRGGEPRNWLRWARANDKDPATLQVNGRSDDRSCTEVKPGDFSPVAVTHSVKVSAGDQLRIAIDGDVVEVDGPPVRVVFSAR